MNTVKTFEDLQGLGAEKIHERTHISRDKIELVLTKSYGEIGQVQFMGFLSILEREYGIDLHDIREEYKAYLLEHQSTTPPKTHVVLQAPSTHRKKWTIAGSVLIAAVVVLGYMAQNYMVNAPQEEVMKLSSLAVEVVTDIDAEENTTADLNATAALPSSENNATSEAEPLPPVQGETVKAGNELVIKPIYKVWVGMIEQGSGAKTQKITNEPITVDTSKNWLITLGHGRVEIQTAAGIQELKEKNTVWFSVENGVLKRLDYNEFKTRNGGNPW